MKEWIKQDELEMQPMDAYSQGAGNYLDLEAILQMIEALDNAVSDNEPYSYILEINSRRPIGPGLEAWITKRYDDGTDKTVMELGRIK